MNFPTSISEIWKRVEKINPEKYSYTRNFEDGAVSCLSPYISRGIINAKDILNNLIERGYKSYQFAKFEQELAWREFWQRIWQKNNNQICIKLLEVLQLVLHCCSIVRQFNLNMV